MPELQPFLNTALEIVHLLRQGADHSLKLDKEKRDALVDNFSYQENGYASRLHIERVLSLVEEVVEHRESDVNDGWCRFFEIVWQQFDMRQLFSSR